MSTNPNPKVFASEAIVALKAVTALLAIVISSTSKTKAFGKGFCGWKPKGFVVSIPAGKPGNPKSL